MMFKVLIGINYPTKGGEKRAEPGDVVDDIPKVDQKWLLEHGAIEPVAETVAEAPVAVAAVATEAGV